MGTNCSVDWRWPLLLTVILLTHKVRSYTIVGLRDIVWNCHVNATLRQRSSLMWSASSYLWRDLLAWGERGLAFLNQFRISFRCSWWLGFLKLLLFQLTVTIMWVFSAFLGIALLFLHIGLVIYYKLLSLGARHCTWSSGYWLFCTKKKEVISMYRR